MKVLMLLVISTFFVVQFKLPKNIAGKFSLVPSGKVVVDDDTLSVQSFYIQSYEVTNKEYNEFLDWLKKNGTPEEINSAKLLTDNWKTETKMNLEQFAKEYHKNEAYDNFPVVNVTYEGALLYCNYLENKINHELKNKEIKVRLPKHAEFIRAGAGDNLGAVYSWNGLYLRNSKGNSLANFTRIPQSTISRNDDGELELQKWSGNHSGSSDLIAEAKSYFPSIYGLYNLNGNVAEMIDEKGIAAGGSWMDYGYDIRLQSRSKYKEASVRVGFRPVFTVIN